MTRKVVPSKTGKSFDSEFPVFKKFYFAPTPDVIILSGPAMKLPQ
jgi:hypothetical protein